MLADEINRMPPRTQAALLESMEERQVTLDGETHALDGYFTVFATQNPLEFEGTYPLPEAQLDRFLLKIRVGYPAAAEERSILERHGALLTGHRLEDVAITPVEQSLLNAARAEVRTRCRWSLRCLSTCWRWCAARASGPRSGAGCFATRVGASLLLVAKALCGSRWACVPAAG